MLRPLIFLDGHAVESVLHKKMKQGQPVVELKGEFTLHGKTRPLTLYAELSQKEGQWNLRGDFAIRQTDFGITPYSAALGTVGVAAAQLGRRFVLSEFEPRYVEVMRRELAPWLTSPPPPRRDAHPDEVEPPC